MKKKQVVGYKGGIYYLFYNGHLNIIKSAKTICDRVIVGVSNDKFVSYKYKKAVIPFGERVEIGRSIKFVDLAIPQEEIDKYNIWKKLRFDILFVGSDWFNEPKWKEYERKLKEKEVKVIYFPYTKGTSSTLLNEVLLKLRN